MSYHGMKPSDTNAIGFEPHCTAVTSRQRAGELAYMFPGVSQGEDGLLFKMHQRPCMNFKLQHIVFLSIQPTFLTVFWPSVRLAVSSLLLSFDHDFFFFCPW